MKTCITCLEAKPLSDFGNYKRYADGKSRICRQCHNAYINRYRWTHGTTPEKPLLERLWEGIQQCNHGEDCPYCCWPWIKGCDEDGYGLMAVSNQGRHTNCRVTHLVWEIHHALPIPLSKVLCHYCDNPPCVNPWHLWPGTRIDNRLDCIKKGRQAKGAQTGQVKHPEAFPRGEKHVRAKLTEADVLEIRARYAAYTPGRTAEALAQMFHVSKFAILCILNRKTWKHI